MATMAGIVALVLAALVGLAGHRRRIARQHWSWPNRSRATNPSIRRSEGSVIRRIESEEEQRVQDLEVGKRFVTEDDVRDLIDESKQ